MNRVENITPYGNAGDRREKSEQVRDMFDNIAPAYDRMNRLMTFGIDKIWRKKCVHAAMDGNPADILDLAAGTGDLTLALSMAASDARVTGADLSEGMLQIARGKMERNGVASKVTMCRADILDLPFASKSFDAVTIAFGVRNLQDIEKGFREMLRVLRPGGRLVVLELAEPESPMLRPLYKLYTRRLIPLAGKMMSHDDRAYSYLPESIAAVPARDVMTDIMRKTGFSKAEWTDLTFGVAVMYSARK